eukprot:11158132-Lingulodinium_polyedra.AAC.1
MPCGGGARTKGYGHGLRREERPPAVYLRTKVIESNQGWASGPPGGAGSRKLFIEPENRL